MGKKARRQARVLQLQALRGNKKRDKHKNKGRGVGRGGAVAGEAGGAPKGLGGERTEFARLLADEAKRRGSRDDITVIVAHYTRDPCPE